MMKRVMCAGVSDAVECMGSELVDFWVWGDYATVFSITIIVYHASLEN
jgi:hypothetical protein